MKTIKPGVDVRRGTMAVWAVVLLGSGLVARGNDHNYQNLLVGDRASGMGGAAVALANSVDAAYYNPAGLTAVNVGSLSLSANLYGFQNFRIEDGIAPKEDMESSSFMTIPTTIGAVGRASTNMAMSVSAFVPDRISLNNIMSHSNGKHLYQYNLDDQTLWVGPSIGIQVSPEFSLGASVFALYRSSSFTENAYWQDWGSSYAAGRKFDDVGLLGLLGAQYSPDHVWKFGATLQSPSTHLYSRGKYEASVVNRLNINSGGESFYSEEVNTDNHLPSKCSLGVAREVKREYAVGVDVSYNLPTSTFLQEWKTQKGEDESLHIVREGVMNLNVGGEYYIQKQYPVRAGFFTNFSSSPGTDPSDPANSLDINLYGLSTSVGKELEHMSLNMGVLYLFGKGTDLGWILKSDETMDYVSTDASIKQIYLMANTSYYF